MKIMILNFGPCSLVNGFTRFEATYYLHHQGTHLLYTAHGITIIWKYTNSSIVRKCNKDGIRSQKTAARKYLAGISRQHIVMCSVVHVTKIVGSVSDD
jgi:hypothetical protein